VGSALAAYDFQKSFHIAAALGFAVGSFAVCMLVAGCTHMVRETRLAIQGMNEDIELARLPKNG
jgi:hypothetical protein